MSDLTPEAARAAAEWLDRTGRYARSPRDLRAEADRLEAASRTPGQVAAAAYYGSDPTYGELSEKMCERWGSVAAAVIAHHVGPDRVVVDRADVKAARARLELCGHRTEAVRLREALS